MGTLHPGIARESGVRDVIVAELNLSALLPAMSETNRFKSYSSFPTVSRDLALVVPSEVAWGRIEEEVSKVKDPLLQRTELFDVYEGKGVPAGSKSLAFSLLFGAERTLTDPEIEASVKKILTRLEASLGAVLRS
jgi:phenylalanyl-tRNA synthetase beta chain